VQSLKQEDITLDKVQGLIAGDGELPILLAQSAKNSGFEVVAISLTPKNRLQLQKYCSKVYSFGPGQVQKILDTLKAEQIKQLTFIGKVSKEMLFRNPKLDKRSISLLKSMKRVNDDAIMLKIIEELNKEGIEVLDQTIFIKNLFLPKGVIGSIQPTEEQLIDIDYGFSLAKEMGRLDIGQSVIVQDKMVLAVEAIEGTDKAIKRGCQLGSGRAVVVKVSKPSQDQRFDIPTVGLQTVKIMKKYGAKVLAIEANETLIVDKEEMVKFADKNKIVIVAV